LAEKTLIDACQSEREGKHKASIMKSIQVEKLVKEFGSVRALDGIDVKVEAGELFFLLGASGCGKTTLLRCIAGLETPTGGKICFGDEATAQARGGDGFPKLRPMATFERGAKYRLWA
jgi:ABC-type Fe3+/spermidine/putrescine transport system ATPase subunit